MIVNEPETMENKKEIPTVINITNVFNTCVCIDGCTEDNVDDAYVNGYNDAIEDWVY